MVPLREKILCILDSYRDDDERLVKELENIIQSNGVRAYPSIFEIITHMSLDPKKAKNTWDALIAHRRYMMERLGRNVGIRTALCDYLGTVNKTLENPMVVEIHVFENHYHSYMYDYLTGLYSRGFLDTILDRELARCRRHENELSILFFDIDNFKSVNDTYGHSTGDVCLAEVSGNVKNAVRTEGRYHGPIRRRGNCGYPAPYRQNAGTFNRRADPQAD